MEGALSEPGSTTRGSHFAPERFVLAVATFNRRAINVYERVGFTRVRVYAHETNGGKWEFVEMERQA